MARPGRLSKVPVVLMGGWVWPPEEGLPAWGPDMDWNVQCDTRAAAVVAEKADLTLVTMPATLKAHLRAAHLPRLRTSGPLGRLLAHQAEAHAQEWKFGDLARAHPGLPDDLLNFNYDPVACAVAEWSAFSDCSGRCGPGNQTRTRGVLQAAQNGGAPCGVLRETR